MGLYSEIQYDLTQAFENDLLDAVRTITVYTVSGEVYDDITMKNVITYSPDDVRAVKVKDVIGENIDSSTSSNIAEFIIIDADKISSGVIFELEKKITDGTNTYKIEGIEQDPAEASWVLTCRIWS